MRCVYRATYTAPEQGGGAALCPTRLRSHCAAQARGTGPRLSVRLCRIRLRRSLQHLEPRRHRRAQQQHAKTARDGLVGHASARAKCGRARVGDAKSAHSARDAWEHSAASQDVGDSTSPPVHTADLYSCRGARAGRWGVAMQNRPYFNVASLPACIKNWGGDASRGL